MPALPSLSALAARILVRADLHRPRHLAVDLNLLSTPPIGFVIGQAFVYIITSASKQIIVSKSKHTVRKNPNFKVF